MHGYYYYLVLARMPVGPDLLVCEEVHGGDLLDLAPVLAVRGEGDVCGAVEEDVGDGGVCSGHEDVVIRAQRSVRRRLACSGDGTEV